MWSFVYSCTHTWLKMGESGTSAQSSLIVATHKSEIFQAHFVVVIRGILVVCACMCALMHA